MGLSPVSSPKRSSSGALLQTFTVPFEEISYKLPGYGPSLGRYYGATNPIEIRDTPSLGHDSLAWFTSGFLGPLGLGICLELWMLIHFRLRCIAVWAHPNAAQ